jgi:hypothetical protein
MVTKAGRTINQPRYRPVHIASKRMRLDQFQGTHNLSALSTHASNILDIWAYPHESVSVVGKNQALNGKKYDPFK